ncbi:uncharacterized protein LAESUDRAFT_759198 [Laetiporus sulphureus 93-53]|uniref:Retrotransposon gag domain-containing protein n=1 Tax=Laetiporus sulphureus 93-53 TaxID=1314785 RepID=A0A165EC28_9APHY|nr:uncharacterized protein LAESUDRAFT_759198 [Laetiporus sulphureus 93-53]KZT06703.1 hypothetical protein LAESUDRAFT_759198 [Laetiporus sulphureus 93-53]
MEETPEFWMQPVDMRRAYQHLQADYNRLCAQLDNARREVTEAREVRLATKATQDRLMRENAELKNTAERRTIECGNQIHKLETELNLVTRALKSSEERVKSLEGINETQRARITTLKALAAVLLPSPIRSPKKLVDKGKKRQDPTQQDIREWATGVTGPAGPSGLKLACQANHKQLPPRVQTPPIFLAESYEGDQDDELAGVHYAFPPEQEIPPPDRDRRSTAPALASSDEVNLPETFDGTKTKAKAWLVDVMNYIIMKPSEFEDEQGKIQWALSYICGPQIDHWKASLLERMMGGAPVYAMLQDFIADFKKMYYPANPELEGQWMLHTLQQRFKPCEEFKAKWEH